MSGTKLQATKKRSERQIAIDDRLEMVRGIIAKHPGSMEAHNINAKRFAMVLTEILMTNPKLLLAEPKSFNHAIVRCIRDGLMPDGKQSVMYLSGKNEIIYIPMREGLLRIIHGALGGQISSNHAREGDEIEYVEDENGPRVNFRKVFRAPGAEIPPLIAAWATLIKTDEHGNQQRHVKVLDADGINKVKDCSRARKTEESPWVRWEGQMAEKSALNSLMRSLNYMVHKDSLGRASDAQVEAYASVTDDDPEFVDSGTVLEHEDDAAPKKATKKGPQKSAPIEGYLTGDGSPPQAASTSPPKDDDPEADNELPPVGFE